MNSPTMETLEDLKRKRIESLMLSEEAIREHPETYRKLKVLVRDIATKTIDIGEYNDVAKKLAELLKRMSITRPGTIFNYYFENIDPRQFGEARYFRAMCVDLFDQLKRLDEWRTNKRKFVLIKNPNL